MSNQPVPAPHQRLQSVRPAACPVGRLGASPVPLAALVTALAAFSTPALAMQAADLPAQNAARVAEAYLVGPAQAAELGCSINWQALIPNPSGHSLALVDCSPFGVLGVNTRNEMTFVRADTGDRAWTASAAERIDRILSAEIVTVATADGGERRIAVTTDTGFYTLDSKDGSSILRKSFRNVPSTRPIVVGQTLVFGTRSGQTAWFDCGSGFDVRGYTVDGPVGRSPVLAQPAENDGVIVAASSQGTVVALDASSGASLWRKELLGGVTAKPGIANGIAFVASEVPLALGATTALPVTWFFFALFGCATIFAYTILTQGFPPGMAGRVNTALNLSVFAGAFALQASVGWAIDLVSTATGLSAGESHRAVIAGLMALQLAALAWYWPVTRRAGGTS